MIGRLVALGAAAVAGVAATAAALRSRRKPDEPSAARSNDVSKPAEATVSDAPLQPKAVGTDDLTALKGVGAVSAGRLDAIGVTTFAQVASWSDEDVDDIGSRIKISPERIRREDWVGQAQRAIGG